MNELVNGLFMVLVEITIVLMAILVVVIYKFENKKVRRKDLVSALVEKLKNKENNKRNDLREMLSGKVDDEIEGAVDVLIDAEKMLYSSLLPIFMDNNIEKISSCDEQIEQLIKQYREIVSVDVIKVDGEKESVTLNLRIENKDLREKLAQSKSDLHAAMRTIEGMMEEFANMYEGGKKEGEQRVKNEMFKLKQNLDKKVDVSDDSEETEKDDSLDISDALAK